MQSFTGTTRVPAPIQIRVHDDRLRIYNPGTLPVGWTLEKLLGPHPSQPLQPGHRERFLLGRRDRILGTRDRPRSSRLQEGRDTGTGGSDWSQVASGLNSGFRTST